MSMITECTVIIDAEDKEKFEEIVNERENRESNVNLVFENQSICVYAFDCNGEPLYLQENMDCYVVEVYYCDGNNPYTILEGEETYKTAEEILRDMLTKEEFESFSIEYSS